MINGQELQISINNVDYSTKISDFSESGGDIIYKIKKTFNNTFRRIANGKNNYTLKITMLVDDDTLHSIFTSTTPITITWKDINNAITINYNNMLPSNITYQSKVDDNVSAELSFEALAYDENGDDNREVL